jgi:hypothetical protein
MSKKFKQKIHVYIFTSYMPAKSFFLKENQPVVWLCKEEKNCAKNKIFYETCSIFCTPTIKISFFRETVGSI